ncbi:MAG: riboflavin synthase [Vicinamibacterales bacterium]
MFTGLIESVGEVVEIRRTASGLRLCLQTALAADLHPGDSLAVNGVCLTVVDVAADNVSADVGPGTARVTTLGALRGGQPVNLERPMRADGRFGGHFVQGHVDGTGAVEHIREEGDSHWLTISFSAALGPYMIPKGSIAVDGISLTVAALDERTFDVMIVPFTWAHTNLSALHPGERVNLECDTIGKYVARAVEQLVTSTGHGDAGTGSSSYSPRKQT